MMPSTCGSYTQPFWSSFADSAGGVQRAFGRPSLIQTNTFRSVLLELTTTVSAFCGCFVLPFALRIGRHVDLRHRGRIACEQHASGNRARRGCVDVSRRQSGFCPGYGLRSTAARRQNYERPEGEQMFQLPIFTCSTVSYHHTVVIPALSRIAIAGERQYPSAPVLLG